MGARGPLLLYFNKPRGPVALDPCCAAAHPLPPRILLRPCFATPPAGLAGAPYRPSSAPPTTTMAKTSQKPINHTMSILLRFAPVAKVADKLHADHAMFEIGPNFSSVTRKWPPTCSSLQSHPAVLEPTICEREWGDGRKGRRDHEHGPLLARKRKWEALFSLPLTSAMSSFGASCHANYWPLFPRVILAL